MRTNKKDKSMKKQILRTSDSEWRCTPKQHSKTKTKAGTKTGIETKTETLMMKGRRSFVFEGLRVAVCPITSIKISISGEAACGARVTPSHSPGCHLTEM